jgi:hypothetical protein
MEPRVKGVKDLRVQPIASTAARRLTVQWHYSRKFVRNSQLHLGVFLGGRCEGVMSFGPSLDKRKLVGLVEGTPWNGFLELNRLAFSDALPRNSESRALAVAMRLLRRHAPHVQWVVSFADATQSGDGTIYRASGFVLTGIRRNTSLWVGPGGETVAKLSVHAHKTTAAVPVVVNRTAATSHQMQLREREIIDRTTVTKGVHLESSRGAASMRAYKAAGFRPLPGFQLRYLYFLDPTARARLTVPVLPFSKIAEMGATMYRGQGPSAGSIVSDAPTSRVGEGGSTPTPALPPPVPGVE